MILTLILRTTGRPKFDCGIYCGIDVNIWQTIQVVLDKKLLMAADVAAWKSLKVNLICRWCATRCAKHLQRLELRIQGT